MRVEIVMLHSYDYNYVPRAEIGLFFFISREYKIATHVFFCRKDTNCLRLPMLANVNVK